jgi:hypothetical protein
MDCNCGARYPIPHKETCPKALPPGIRPYCSCGGTGVKRDLASQRFIHCDCGRKPSSAGAKKLAAQEKLDKRLEELRREAMMKKEEERRFVGPDQCCVCQAVKNDDESPVTWRCIGCGRAVCRQHTLTIPGSVPLEYYYDTLCSHACWEKIGSPEE